MTIIDRLIGLVGFERDPGSDAAERDYNESLDNMSDNVGRLATLAAAAATAVVGIGVAAGGIAARVAASTDELGKFAAAKGLGFGDVQEIIYAGEIFGSTKDQIVGSLGAIQDKLAEYKRGQGDFQLLGQIGVSAQGVDAVGFIERLADRFQNFSNERAQELGGKLGLDSNFIELLRSGTAGLGELRAEARSLGIILDDDAAASAAAFQDAMLRVSRVINNVRDTVVLRLAPAISDFANQLTTFVRNNRELIEQRLDTFLETVFVILQGMGRTLVNIIDLWSSFVQATGSARNALLLLGIGYVAFQAATSASLLKVIASMRAVGAATTLVNAKVLLIPVLIAGAVAAALLILQDLYVFAQGGDSLFGQLIDGVKEWRAELTTMKPVVDALLLPFDLMVAAVEKIAIFIAKFNLGEFDDTIATIVNSPVAQLIGATPGQVSVPTQRINERTGLPYNERRVAIDVSVTGDLTGVPNAREVVRGSVTAGAEQAINSITPVDQ